jgi:hypothetical protein
MPFSSASNRFAYGKTQMQPTIVQVRDQTVRAGNHDNVIPNQQVELLIQDDDDDDDERTPPLSGKRLDYVTSVLKRVKELCEKTKDGALKALQQTENGWIRAKNPMFDSNHGCDPNRYGFPDVYVWLPRAFPTVKIICPKCHSDHTKSNGWPSKPIARRVVSLESCYFLVSRRQKCLDCNSQFNGYNPAVLSQLPLRFKHLFPAHLTERSGVDISLLSLLRTSVSESFGFAAFRRMLMENHMRTYHTQSIQYYDSVNSIPFSQKRQFPEFKSAEYGGHVPSSRYLGDLYVEMMAEHESSLLAQMAKVSAEQLAVDHSHKVLPLISLSLTNFVDS